MRIVSFNINGIRARPHQLAAVTEQLAPAILGLQETKVQDAEFPQAEVEALGYQVAFHGQKGHYGVALLSRQPPLEIIRGLPGDDEAAQRRLIGGVFDTPQGHRLVVLNGYFPQGESRDHPEKFPAKRKFYADLLGFLRDRFSPEDKLLLMGDMNIAPQDLDIGIGADNAKRWLRTGKCSFLPEEREWMAALQNWGLQDCYRRHYPEAAGRYSWFDYRSKGFEQDPPRGLRIDLVLATPALNKHCTGAGIGHEIRGMERPSDHCPVWADFDL
jgi:exodeoxyribonuclease III